MFNSDSEFDSDDYSIDSNYSGEEFLNISILSDKEIVKRKNLHDKNKLISSDWDKRRVFNDIIRHRITEMKPIE